MFFNWVFWGKSCYLIPYFGQYQLSDIAPAMIQKFISAEIKKGKLSSSSVKTILIVLKAVFKRAVILSYLKHNPAQNIEGPKVVHKEGSILTPAEIRTLLEVTEEPWRTLFTVAAMTGMRRGEILALKWSDIDFEKKLIFVRRSVFRGEFSDPKSKKSIRVLAMDNRLLSVLLNHKLNAPASQYDLVFCTPKGGIVSGGHVTKVQFKKAVKDAGIEKPMRFHDLRHSFASLLISKGEHVKVIQSVLGHADIQTTMNIYGHLLPETHIESAAKASSAIFDE
ncbi:MAG: tyrosine-type recombinase/integrase [Actinomycetota bacterium]|nr:tyrosine-type recombinase/integrase [Actinomycetota bacterium]